MCIKCSPGYMAANNSCLPDNCKAGPSKIDNCSECQDNDPK